MEKTNANVVLPEHFKNAKVIFVGSEEHQKLIESENNFKKSKQEVQDLQNTKRIVEEQLRNNEEITNKLIKENNELQIKVYQKQATIWKLIFAVGGLSVGLLYMIKMTLLG